MHCPTAAAACRVGMSFGRDFSESLPIPATIAPEETKIISKPTFFKREISSQRTSIRDRFKPRSGEAQAKAVPSGEADMIVVTISLILAYDGVQLVGPVPSEVQFYNRFAAGVGTNAREPEAAKALLKLITSPAAVPVIKAKGMEPGSPR